MIEFKEDQESIFISRRKKLVPSDFDNHLDLHLVYETDKNSGYDSWFVRIITFENIYGFDKLKAIDNDNFEDEFDFKYFENGGYEYDNKTFKQP